MAATKRAKARRTAITQDALLNAKYICDGKISPTDNFAVDTLAETLGKGEKQAQRLAIWQVVVDG